KHRQLAQAISAVGCAALRRQLAYTAWWYGCRVIVSERRFASSRTCSGCGWRDETLTLADRTFACQRPDRPDCGLVIDRDLHAASNFAKLAGSASDSPTACGAGSAGGGACGPPRTCPR